MKNKDIITAAVKRKRQAIEAERDNREEALDDLGNLVGTRQWPQDVRRAREDAGRPVLTINRLAHIVRQITGDLRRMNPSINISPGDDAASQEVAEIYEGIIRDIQYASNATRIYERAAEQAAQCGMGYFRILTDYVSEDSFEQEIRIEPINNPFAVYCDPAARESTREDANFWFVDEVMTRKEFEDAYPGKAMAGVDGDDQTDDIADWRDGDDVIVSEYFWKEPVKRTLALLADGTVTDNPPKGVEVLREREVESHRVMWAKVSQKDVLEGPQEIPCRYIPLVAVMGEEIAVGPELVRTSAIRFAKDPQRLYNYWRSAQTELVALQPKAPYLVTPTQIAGLETFWGEANDSNRPYLVFNPDPKAPGIPARATPPIPSQGMMQEVLTAVEDMKATTGIYDAALGNRSNETSGVAIRQRQMESDVSTSIYSDNMAAAIEHCGRILVAMIPKVYDTQRQVNVTAKDGTRDIATINRVMQTEDGFQVENDLTVGKYAVKVAVGPNYSTRRQEAAESMIDFARAFPAALPVVGDLIAKHMDWPGADEFAERLKTLLPPQLQDADDMTPEQQQAQAQQAQLQAMQMKMAMAEREAEIRKATAEAGEAESDAQKAKFEVMEQQLETMAKTGQLDAAIAQIVQQEVARALYGAQTQPF